MQFALSQEQSNLSAAAKCCEAIARKFAKEADRQIGKLRISSSQLVSSYSTLAKDLRKKAAMRGTPYCGGLSKSEASDSAADIDLIQPYFNKDMMTND